MKNNHNKTLLSIITILMMIPFSFISNSVLVIDGLSCSGKTTICNHLQAYFPQSKIISIDDHAWKLWIKLAIQLNIITENTPMLEKYRLISEQFSKIAPHLANQIPQAMQQLYIDCENSAKNNSFTILDTVFYILSDDEIDFFWQKVKNQNTFITLLYCSPIQMVKRLIQRNSSPKDKFQYRRGLNPFFQFCKKYKPTTPQKGFAILTQKEITQALDMLKIYLLATHTADKMFFLEKISALQNQFLTTFFPHNEELVYITTETPYDFFLNTESLIAEEYANIIYQKYLQFSQIN